MKTFLVFVVALLIGNWVGDQATLRNCAISGKAKMMGRGSIACAVVKE